MSSNYIQSLFAKRIGGDEFGKDKKIYKFEKIKIAKREALKANPDTELIDMGVGEPDDMAFPGVVNALCNEAKKEENRGYSDNGIIEFKEAAAKYMEKVLGVGGINPETEINHVIGSKSALAMFPSLIINEGDVVLMTTPGYPVLGTHCEWYGGEVYNMPLYEKNNFFPDFDAVPADILKRAKLLYLNYPNNPTGKNATYEFYEKVVAFAKANNIVVIQDAAYAALQFKGKPLSFLSVPGAKEVGVEFHSLSKSYNMTGWRIAFVCGNELLVKAFAYVKDNYDSGQFIAIQKAAIYALNHVEITEEINKKYKRRLELLVEVLKGVGFDAKMPDGTFYLYFKAPKGVKNGVKFETGEDFSQYLIKKKLISSVPWDDAGNFVRMSATFSAKGETEEKRVINEIKKRLSDIEFEF